MVKNIFNKYDITLEKRPNYGLKAVGNEFKLRFCMSEYVFAEREGVTNDIFDSQLPGLIKENVNDIWDIILEESQASNITLSDIAMNNLFIHIAITYKRVETGHHITLYPREFKDIKAKKSISSRTDCQQAGSQASYRVSRSGSCLYCYSFIRNKNDIAG
ncbi:PRD domain-containing protein [Sinobaca sp. H24]|uniref:PRD domain-containing protein n=1 Tax=Sinobaca sp. H24 TaxID=2923376 RepID=UPI0020793D06|nr:PRD domain-containing protein [Sinobaca sp. H24]